jgi:Fe-S cluster assembly protein SufD
VSPFESLQTLITADEVQMPAREGETASNGRRRQVALDSFRRLGFDIKKREEWKYGNVGPLTQEPFRPRPESATTTAQISEAAALLPASQNHRLAFINGVFCAELSDIGALPEGIRLAPLAGTNPDDLGLLARLEHAPVTALNTAFWQDGLLLEAAAGAQVDRPVELFFFTDVQAARTMVSPRNLILAGPDSRLTVIERYLDGMPDGESALITPVTEITCAENATVEHIKVFREGRDQLHYGSTHVRQLAGSHYRSREIALGGRSLRRELHVDLDGTGADCDLKALYLADGEQHMDLRTRVNHNVPGCQTDELYKGILDGKARAVFDGLIKVARDAQQTEAYQTNRNLVLSDDTFCYSIPRLEIYADDVKCSHGSTTGQMDEEQLFFLRSRGFDSRTARAMLTLAFAREIMVGISDRNLADFLLQETENRLATMARHASERENRS